MSGRIALDMITPVDPSRRDLFVGWPVACFSKEIYPYFGLDLPWSPFDIRFQIKSIALLNLQYTDPDGAELYLAQWMGPGFTISRVDNSASIIPGSLIAWSSTAVIIFVSGTSTDLQLGTQAFQSLLGPFNFGPYKTLPLWEEARGIMSDRLTVAGLMPTQPIMCVGHSYGGAVSTLLSYLLAKINPLRKVGSLTFGAPPIGDVGRRTILPSNLQLCTIANVGDPVPSLPPANEELLWIGAMVPFAPLPAWTEWRRPTALLQLTDQGLLSYADGETANFVDLLNAAIAAVGGLPYDPGFAHSTSEYLRRLLLVLA